MCSHASGYRSDTEVVGKPNHQGILWRANQPLFSGFLETKNVYEKGTAETRRYLVNECSLIYECNVCRNMFRSLASFIKHKRLYCCMLFNQMNTTENHFQDGYQMNQKQTLQDNGDNLGDLIMRVINGEKKNKRSNCKVTPAMGLKMRTCGSQEEASSASLQKHSSSPEFQRNSVDTDSRKNTTDEIRQSNSNEDQLMDANRTLSVCDVCEKTFDTVKSLKLHKYKKHGTTKYDYQCPSCPLTFLKPATVVQHLSNDHKKSIRCIKLMRDAIQKQRVLKDKILKKSLVKQELRDIRRYEPENEHDSKCSYCQKTFIRKAVLITHQNICRLKNLCSNIDDNSEEYNKQPKQEATQSPEERKTLQDLEDNLISTDMLSNGANDMPEKQNQENVYSDSERSLMERCSSQDSLCNKKNNQKLKSKYLPCLCKICNKHFNALSNLRRHISMFHYRTRKFGCKLCEYRAFRKYDVINHLGHIHSILGDKDTISLDYIAVHEEKSAREDVDDDVVLVTDEKKQGSVNKIEENPSEQALDKSESTSIFKTKGFAPFVISARVQKSIPKERSKLKRSRSKISMATPGDARHKRPKRNRITPVEKDFVYDLSTILKSDVNYPESVRHIKRRDAVLLASNVHASANESGSESPKLLFSKPLSYYSTDLIKGASQRLAVSLVSQGRASYSSLPQLPTERPQVRMRHATIYRADFTAVPIIETTDLEEAPLNVKMLDGLNLETLSKSFDNEFKQKPLPHSTINSLLKKVDLTLRNRMKMNTEELEAEVVPALPKFLFKQETPITNIAEDETYSKLFCLHQKQNSHIQLMECLVENKAQNNDSMLRFALEN